MASSQAWRRGAPLLIAAVLAAGVAGHALGDGIPPGDGTLAPVLLAGPLRTLKVATLDLPQPIGTATPADAPPAAGRERSASRQDALPPQAPGQRPELAQPAPQSVSQVSPDDLPAEAETESGDAAFQFPPPLVLSDDADREPTRPAPRAHLEVALDILLDLPGIADAGDVIAEGASYGPDISALDAARPLAPPGAAVEGEEAARSASPAAALASALHHDPVAVFGSDPALFPPLAFEYHTLASQGFVPMPLTPPAAEAHLAATEDGAGEPEGIWPSPAQRLGLGGERLARAQKCLAEAIYYESRGEPKRGQIAVAQVVVNRVFSGYYPADVCGTVYQNAHRHLACQFTFACDDVKEVVREPDMWVQAKSIAADMLDGRLWLDSVGRATHYHAYWVHPRWVREMRKLDRIGVHTFYRPRRWEG